MIELEIPHGSPSGWLIHAFLLEAGPGVGAALALETLLAVAVRNDQSVGKLQVLDGFRAMRYHEYLDCFH